MRKVSRLVTLLSIVALPIACSANGEKIQDTSRAPSADTATQDVEQDGCGELDQQHCEARADCSPIEGWQEPEACLVWMDDPAGGLPKYAGCAPVSACRAAFTWATSPTASDDIWLFSSGCRPDGWDEVDEAPCGHVCPESDCVPGEIKCDESHFAEIECEDACLELPDCSTCGVWGETLYHCAWNERCPEELNHCACPYTECNWCCDSVMHVCDPDGHCCLPTCSGEGCDDDGCGG